MLKTELGEILHTGLTISDAFEKRSDAANASQWTVIVERDSPSAEELEAYNRVARQFSIGPMSYARPQTEYSADVAELSASTPLRPRLMITTAVQEDESGNLVIPSTEREEESERQSFILESRSSAKAKRPRPRNSGSGADHENTAPAPKRLKPSALSKTIDGAEQSTSVELAKNKVNPRRDVFDIINIFEDLPSQPALGSRKITGAGKSTKSQHQPDLPGIGKRSPLTALDDRVGVRTSVARSISSKTHNVIQVDSDHEGHVNGMKYSPAAAQGKHFKQSVFINLSIAETNLFADIRSNQDSLLGKSLEPSRSYSDRINSVRTPERYLSEEQDARIEKLRVEVGALRADVANSETYSTPKRTKLTPLIPGSGVKPAGYVKSSSIAAAASHDTHPPRSPSSSPLTNRKNPPKSSTDKTGRLDKRKMDLINKDKQKVRSLLKEDQAEDSEVHADESVVEEVLEVVPQELPLEKRKRGRPTNAELAARREKDERARRKLHELGISPTLDESDDLNHNAVGVRKSKPESASTKNGSVRKKDIDTTTTAPRPRGRPVGSKNKPRSDDIQSSKKKTVKGNGVEKSDAVNDDSFIQPSGKDGTNMGKARKGDASDKVNDNLQLSESRKNQAAVGQQITDDEEQSDGITNTAKSTIKRKLAVEQNAAQPSKKVKKTNESSQVVNLHAMDESEDRPAVLAVLTPETQESNRPIITKIRSERQPDRQGGGIVASSNSRSPAKEVMMSSGDESTSTGSDSTAESFEALRNARNQSGQPKLTNDHSLKDFRTDSDLEPKIPKAKLLLLSDKIHPRSVAETRIPLAKQTIIDLTNSEEEDDDDEKSRLPLSKQKSIPSSNDQAEAQLLAESKASRKSTFVDLFPHPTLEQSRNKPRRPTSPYTTLSSLKQQATTTTKTNTSNTGRGNSGYISIIRASPKEEDDDDSFVDWFGNTDFDNSNSSSSSDDDDDDHDDDDNEIYRTNPVGHGSEHVVVVPTKKPKRPSTKKAKQAPKKKAAKKSMAKSTKKGFRGLMSYGRN